MLHGGMGSRCAAALLVMAIAGCTLPTYYGNVTTEPSAADQRLTVVSRPITPPQFGKAAVPAQIVCLEPSPDVAKAVSTAVQAGLSGEGRAVNPAAATQVAIDAAVAVSRARAESVAQLTERLATIQLLRDGLYRACEAYANGAVGPISYALLLSRYGETMVTMLGSELATGAFGRQLATADASAGGSAGAALAQSQADADTAKQTQANLDKAKADLDQLTTQSTSDDPAVRAAAQAKLPAAQASVADITLQRGRDQRASALSLAQARAAAGGKIEGRAPPGAEAVAAIAKMQELYITAPHLPPLLVACVTALQNQPSDRPEEPFVTMCKGDNGLIGQIAKAAIRIAEKGAGVDPLRPEAAPSVARRRSIRPAGPGRL